MHDMRRKIAGTGILFLMILKMIPSPAQTAAKGNDPPNIIIILTDDQGYHDVGFTGGTQIPTPNIDRIARQGVVFRHGYVSYSVCSPSRAGLLTGRYQGRFGHGRNPILAPNDSTMGLPLEEKTLADALNRAGYNSMVVGKWHLGAHEVHHPLSRGFDEFYGFLIGGHQYFPEKWILEDLSEIENQWDGYLTKLLQNHTRVEEDEYITDAFSREAANFIQRNRSGPFFLCLAYNAPHTPLQATEKYLKRFEHIEDPDRRTYAAMVSAVDDGVGDMLDKLQELGIENNTLVFFLSDNGGPEQDNSSDNGPLRAGKGTLFEGGIHIPFAAQWPGHIPRGIVYDKPVISLDIFATGIAIAGLSPDPEHPVDGTNLMPYLTGKTQGAPHDYLFWRMFDKKSYAVRHDTIKLMIPNDQSKMLFDLEDDISETTDLSGIHPDILDDLNQQREKWEEKMINPVFTGLLKWEEYFRKHHQNYNCNPPDKAYPVGVEFHENTISRKGHYGDNWCQTWASDGNIYTMMDDGNGWWGRNKKIAIEKMNMYQGSMCIQIKGDEDFTADDVKRMPGWPKNPPNSPLYAYGIVSVDGTLYVWLWKSESDSWYQRPIANRLLYSPDLGQTFYRWNGRKETEETFSETDSCTFFLYKEDPTWKIDRYAYAFNWIAFCQAGKDNSKDDYVYMYAPEQYDPTKLAMIRVNKKHILNKEKYEYFKGWDDEEPLWTKDMSERGVNLQYPKKRSDGEWMWASWFPSVVYNPGLDLYIMVSYGVTDEGKNFWDGWCRHCKYPGSLGFWYAENPWGPWKQFYYSEYFYADRKENRTYGFKLSPKWIGEDGKTMQLIWSDAGDDHSTNYKWNQMEIEILIEQHP